MGIVFGQVARVLFIGKNLFPANSNTGVILNDFKF